MMFGCGRFEVLEAVCMWSVGGSRSIVDVVGWRYWMLCGCGRLEVLDAVWMWSFGSTRCGVDVVGWMF